VERNGLVALTREEYEVHVRLGWGDDELTVTTSDPKWYRHMLKMGAKPYTINVDKEGDEVSWVFKVSSDWFRAPRPKKQISEAERRARSERMKARFADEDEED
jgi:hypothetical protein